MNLSKQITLGFALMFFLLLVMSAFSIYNIYRLDKSASNVEGRYNTLSSIFSNKDILQGGYMSNELLLETVKISNEQVKFAYINIFTIVGVTILFGGALTFIFPGFITKSIYQLVNAAKAVSSGDYSYRVKMEKTSNEMSLLINAFNNMLENIESNNKMLEEKNEEIYELLQVTKRFNEKLEAKVEEATKEIKEKQKELIKSEKLATIGELAAGVAHEIRNPLSGIAIALELMTNETDNSEHKQTISDILNEILRLDRIIKELLQLGHPRSLNLIECTPNEIVEKALNLVTLKAKEKGIEIRKEFKCDGTFFVDYELIEQVILNILLNGIESMDKYPGKIAIQTIKNNGFVSIVISDNGRGIDEKDTEKIFQPFYSTKAKGTGLGLTISSRIIENHLGEIIIDSKEGSGTSFTLKIPSDLTESGDMIN